MSGGSLNYVSGYIDDAVNEIDRRINGEDVDECDIECLIKEYDLDETESKYVREHHHTMPNPFYYSQETLAQMRTALHHLKVASIYVHRLEWLFSGDDGEESFHERLREDLDKLKEEENE